ncbi:MAG: sigma-70 family RNA polymerase sigma factor [Verrucomicrobiota bacterium]
MRECMQTYGALVWSIAQKYLANSTDAQDLTQEVFTELWRKAGSFNPQVASEKTFIATIARRRSIDWIRKQGRRPTTEPMSPEMSDLVVETRDPSHALDRQALLQAMTSLAPETQTLFRLHFERGYTHREIAEETELPLGTVKSRLRQGLLDLRSQLRRSDWASSYARP